MLTAAKVLPITLRGERTLKVHTTQATADAKRQVGNQAPLDQMCNVQVWGLLPFLSCWSYLFCTGLLPLPGQGMVFVNIDFACVRHHVGQKFVILILTGENYMTQFVV